MQFIPYEYFTDESGENLIYNSEEDFIWKQYPEAIFYTFTHTLFKGFQKCDMRGYLDDFMFNIKLSRLNIARTFMSNSYAES